MKNIIKIGTLLSALLLTSVNLFSMDQTLYHPKSLAEQAIAKAGSVAKTQAELDQVLQSLPAELRNQVFSSTLLNAISSSSTIDEAINKLNKLTNAQINQSKEVAGVLIKALANKFYTEYNRKSGDALRAEWEKGFWPVWTKQNLENQIWLTASSSFDPADPNTAYLIYAASKLNTPGAREWIKEVIVKTNSNPIIGPIVEHGALNHRIIQPVDQMDEFVRSLNLNL